MDFTIMALWAGVLAISVLVLVKYPPPHDDNWPRDPGFDPEIPD